MIAMSMTAFELLGVLKLDASEFNSGMESAVRNGTVAGNLISDAIGAGAKAIEAGAKAVIGFGQSSVSAATSFESAFTGVRKTVDATEQEYDALSGWIMDASTRMASSKEEIAATMEIAGQLGIRGVEGLEKFTETMIMLGDTTNLNAEEAASALAKFGNIAGIAAEDTDRIGSVIVALGNNFATTEADIVNMSTRLASAGTIAGLSATDILALSTAMSSVGINAEAGGTAMSTIITKMGRAVDGGLDPANDKLQLFAAVAGTSAEDFIDAWKTEPTAALQDFVKGLDSVIDSGGNVTGILDDLGIKGIRETNTIKSLALASDVLTGAVGMANQAFADNTALQNEAELRYGTLESQTKQAAESFKNLQVQIGEKLTPVFQEFLGLSSSVMQSMTEGFNQNGVEGLMESFGQGIAQGLEKVLNYMPNAINMGKNLIGALVKGISQNRKKILDTGVQIIKAFVDGILGESPTIVSAFQGIADAIDGVLGFIERNSSMIQSALKGILAGFLAYRATLTVFDAMKTGITAIGTAVKIMNGEMALSAVLNPYTAIAAAVGVLVGVLVASADANEKAKQKLIELSDAQQAILESSQAYAEQMAHVREENERLAGSIDQQFANEAALIDELKSITDENGVVMDGYEERAAQITGELSNAFGVEIQYTDGVISNYQEIVGQLDQILERKKLQALIDANAGQYSDAYGKQVELLKNLTTAQSDYNQALKEAEQAEANDAQLHREIDAALKDENMARADYLSTQIDDSRNAAEVARGHAEETKKMLDEASKAYAENQNFISEMDSAYEAATDTTKDAGEAFHNLTNGLIEDGPAEVMAQQVADVTEELQGLLEAQQQGAQISDETIAQTTEKLAEAIALMTGDDFEEMAKNIPAGTAEGIAEHDDVIEAAKTMISDAEAASKEQGGINSPSTVFKEIGRFLVEGLRDGLQSGFPVVISFLKSKISEMTKLFTDFVSQAVTWGSDLISSFVGGIKANWQTLTDTVSGVAQTVADYIGFSEPSDGALANFHTFAPDMMKLFAEGIKDNENLVRDQLADSLSFGGVTANVAPPDNSQIISLLQQIRDEGRVQVTLEGDADRLFRAMQRKATANYRLTGNPGLVTV